MLLKDNKPILVGTIIRLLYQTKSLEVFNENLSKVDTNIVVKYFFGDSNVTL